MYEEFSLLDNLLDGQAIAKHLMKKLVFLASIKFDDTQNEKLTMDFLFLHYSLFY